MQTIRIKPHFVPKNYLKEYNEPIKTISEGNGFRWEYAGTGVRISEHPLKKGCDMHGCGSCKSRNVKVIYAQMNIHPMSGDKYYDYEIFCEDCGKYTTRSYAEN